MAGLMKAAALLTVAAALLALAFLARPVVDVEQDTQSSNVSQLSREVELPTSDTVANDDVTDSEIESNRDSREATTSGIELPADFAQASSTARPAASDRSTPQDSAERGDGAEPKLSPYVVSVLTEVQRRQLAEQWEEALNELNALYQDYDTLSSFEQSTLLNFYSNTLLSLQMWEEAISAFTMMLTIPNLEMETNARATLALGQLHTQAGDLQTAAAYYRAWLDESNITGQTPEQIERVRGLLQAIQIDD